PAWTPCWNCRRPISRWPTKRRNTPRALLISPRGAPPARADPAPAREQPGRYDGSCSCRYRAGMPDWRNTMNEVVVTAAARTAIGDFGGALKDVPPIDLGAAVIKEALTRAGVAGAEVGHVAMGHVINTEPRDMYLSRVAAMNAGIGKETPAFNVNRLCGSGLQAIVSAAQTIMLGDTEIAVGGGAESMSRAPYIAPAQRWGARMGDAALLDMMTGALSDPFGRMHMGVTAENVAAKFGISRADQDAL